MRKEFTISIDVDDGLEKALDNIRWQHIDIKTIIEEELREYVEMVIRAYGEVE